MSDAQNCSRCGAVLSPNPQATPAPPPGNNQLPDKFTPGGTLILPPPAGPSLYGRLPRPGLSVHYFGDYELLEEINRGGMGVVYKARQVSLNRIVAIKMILSGQLATPAEVKRFQAEAEATGVLNHPNIVGIYEVGELHGSPYFSMPFVEGQSLAQLMQAGLWPGADGKESARLLAKIARAVAYAHQKDILHRDIKPANILVDTEGEPHVLDFGLAKHITQDTGTTLSGMVLGTPSFMAPEQAAGKNKEVTVATDIYGLGAVLYYLLTGRPPFVADTPMDALVQVLEAEAILPRAVNPLIPAELERICLRCLEKFPQERYHSAAELADDLERFLRGEPLAMTTLDLMTRTRQWALRQPALLAHLGALSLCAVIAQTFYLVNRHVPLSFHLRIMVILGVWAMASTVFQWWIRRERQADLARYIWAVIDVTLLTFLLKTVEAMDGPLMAVYFALVAGSGLWLRMPLVVHTTALSVLGYCLLVCDDYWDKAQFKYWHWHFIYVVALLVTGFVVAYLVYRVRTLSRFCERKG